MKHKIPKHPTRLYLIRHGEVDHRYHQIFGGGRIDMDLSETGHFHAAALADWFGDGALDQVYVSPMKRAAQTADPLLRARGLEGTVMEGLREVDFGDWTGYRWSDIQDRFGIAAFDWLEVLERGGIANGESANELRARVEPCIQSIMDENAHRSVAVVCHGGIVRVMLALLLELPLSHMAHFNVDYGSVTMLEIQPHKKHAVEIELLNFCPTVDRDGTRIHASERALGAK